VNQFIACSDATLRTRLKNLREQPGRAMQEQAYQVELELKRRAALARQAQKG
jgi:hypothetical protein